MAICIGPPDRAAAGEPTVEIGAAGAGGLLGLLMGLAVAGVAIVRRATGLDYPRAVLMEGQPGGYVTEYSSSIKIVGTPEYQGKVIQDLGRLRDTKTGRGLIESLDESGRSVTIQAPPPGKRNQTECSDDGFLRSDGNPGKGTDSVIGYDPSEDSYGPEAWQTRPPAIGLGHELVHADDAAHGTLATGTAPNDAVPDPRNPSRTAKANVLELEAAGIPPHDSRPFTENKIRAEWDPPQPQRKWY